MERHIDPASDEWNATNCPECGGDLTYQQTVASKHRRERQHTCPNGHLVTEQMEVTLVVVKDDPVLAAVGEGKP